MNLSNELEAIDARLRNKPESADTDAAKNEGTARSWRIAQDRGTRDMTEQPDLPPELLERVRDIAHKALGGTDAE